MNFLSRLLGRQAPPADAGHSRLLTRPTVPQPQPSPQGLRTELLRMTLRDTLRQCGIPLDWISGDTLAASTRHGQRGVHWRLTLRHSDPRLMASLAALQERLLAQLRRVDAKADGWLLGVAWEFALPATAVPAAMPPASTWTQNPGQAPRVVRRGGSADVISGPVHIEDGAAKARRMLQEELAARDGAYAPGEGSEATQPMDLRTRPMDLA